MISELDSVVLTRDIPDKGLVAGDVGAVVHVHGSGEAFEVEFVNGMGKTVAVLTLPSADIRCYGEKDMLHAREFSIRVPA